MYLTFALLFGSAKAAEPEFWYQKVWCEGNNGKVEERLNDGRRVDCVTDSHAIEMDFANKWPEAIGQSLDYAMLTKKQAGIVLILKKSSDQAHWDRLQQVVDHYQLPVTTWKLGP
ncbi:hypothetical protein GZ78_25410 [Endozoicomonas numazuensis]|uniref:Uncharacterized protein n=1 Tax=Endozoicomonas numazuensis TaxID=1137799 RepID=A0A081N6A8_9GAMM|nr:hypothetical protein GZ78_25410 [Endozoicomonas numazuensis]